MTNSAFRFGDERFAERRLGKTKIDLNAGASVFHFPRRRGLKGYTEIVQSSGPGQAGVDSGVENIVAAAEELFHVLEGEALQKILGRNPSPGRKKPMKMKRTQPGGAGERG